MSDEHVYGHLNPKPDYEIRKCEKCEIPFTNFFPQNHRICALCQVLTMKADATEAIEEAKVMDIDELEAGNEAMDHYQARIDQILDDLVPPEIFPQFTRMSARSILKVAQRSELHHLMDY